MATFNTYTLLLILGAIFGYLNTRFVRLPITIAYMLGALIFSLLLLLLRLVNFAPAEELINRFGSIDFGSTVLYGILSFLLFAGALQFDIADLAREKWVILTLATIGVVISTFIVGVLMFWVFRAFGIFIDYAHALLFGALISPTDPVIIIGALKGCARKKSAAIKIMGESLFNDGIAIVLFTAILAFSTWPSSSYIGHVGWLLVRQILGSIVLGLILGWVVHRLLCPINVFSVQVLLTVGLVAGGYNLATSLEMSGPIAVVIAGLIVRNYRSRRGAPVGPAYEELFHFWEMLDEFLNAVLFLLMGLDILTIPFMGPEWAAGTLAIIVVLIGRYISVFIPIRVFGLFRTFTENIVNLLTWAGLRGGISLALAFSLPRNPEHNAILVATYMVVLFSTLVQGLTVKKFIEH
jgi:monovalent cation:H+ antiporter, CPA1 family